VAHGIVKQVTSPEKPGTNNLPQTHFQQAEDIIIAANRGLLRADAYCQNNSSCPLIDKGKGIIPKVGTCTNLEKLSDDMLTMDSFMPISF
jgi:hypothetical protein